MSKFVTGLWAFLTVFTSSSLAFAQEAGAALEPIANNPHMGVLAVAIGLGLGLAAVGCAYGQSKAAAAALEGIARNPGAADKILVPLLLSLAFIESLFLVTWVLLFLVRNKL